MNYGPLSPPSRWSGASIGGIEGPVTEKQKKLLTILEEETNV